VTIKYVDGKAHSIDTVVLSTQHAPEMTLEAIREAAIEEIIKPVLPKELIKGNIKFLVNPTGRFVIGGPQGELRSDWTQDYCGHLRWCSAPRRRRFLRQGSIKGGSFCCLCRPLCRQEYCCSRFGIQMPDPDFLCDRRGRTY